MYHRDELELDLLYLRRLTGDLLLDRLRGGDLLLGGDPLLSLYLGGDGRPHRGGGPLLGGLLRGGRGAGLGANTGWAVIS